MNPPAPAPRQAPTVLIDVDERELAQALAFMSPSDLSKIESALEDEARRQDQAEAIQEAPPLPAPVLDAFFGPRLKQPEHPTDTRPDVRKGT